MRKKRGKKSQKTEYETEYDSLFHILQVTEFQYAFTFKIALF